jgi:uncharacterized protein
MGKLHRPPSVSGMANRAGSELTVDYGTLTDSPDFRIPCHCGTARCRRSVTGRDWERADLQDAYGDHWVPVLRERITAARRLQREPRA